MPTKASAFSTACSNSFWFCDASGSRLAASDPRAMLTSGSSADSPTPSASPDSSSATSISTVCEG